MYGIPRRFGLVLVFISSSLFFSIHGLGRYKNLEL